MIIQFAVFFIVSLFGVLLIIKSVITNRHIKMSMILGIIIIFIGVIGILGNGTYNDSFTIYQTPEAAFNSTHNSEIICTLEGNESAFIYAHGRDAFEYSVIPKVDNGWKVGNMWDSELVILKGVETISVRVYKFKDSDDYYLEIVDSSGRESEIFDNHNTEFYSYNYKIDLVDKTYYVYLAYVNNLDNEYVLTIGNIEIPMIDDENTFKYIISD